MLKGTQRQMVMINMADSEFFDVAYFVLRRDASAKKPDDSAIVAEANKIVTQAFGDAMREKKEKRKNMRKKLALFALGALFGGGAALFLYRLITLL